jgi:prepilin-type N-terminal cleavage/methylation domain-containing protein
LETLKTYNKGLSLIECLIALFLATIAAVSLVNMQTLAWVGAGKSDYWGRAAVIMQRELDTHESEIVWGTPPANNNIVTTCADASGNSVLCTNASKVFTITYTPTIPSGAVTTYLVNVKITWPGSHNGVRSSKIVYRSS